MLCYVILRCIFVTNKLSDVVVNLSCVNKGFFACVQNFVQPNRRQYASWLVLRQLDYSFSFSKSELIASRRGKQRRYDFNVTYGKLQLVAPPGGGGTQQMFTGEGSAPRSNPLPFYILFFTKKYLFCLPSVIDNWYPFHILCLKPCIPFNCCKCTVLLKKNHIKP